jgi:hypothetical protein
MIKDGGAVPPPPKKKNPQNRNLKNMEFVVRMILKVLHDPPFS